MIVNIDKMPDSSHISEITSLVGTLITLKDKAKKLPRFNYVVDFLSCAILESHDLMVELGIASKTISNKH